MRTPNTSMCLNLGWLVVCAIAAGPAAYAGSLNYGCVGDLPSGNRVIFDRGSLITVPAALAADHLSTVESGEIEAYASADENSGFQPKMVFTHDYAGAAPDTTTFTEKSSKTVKTESHTVKCTNNRVREIDRTLYKKSYEIEFNASGAAPSGVIKLEMNCYEYSVSACG